MNIPLYSEILENNSLIPVTAAFITPKNTSKAPLNTFFKVSKFLYTKYNPAATAAIPKTTGPPKAAITVFTKAAIPPISFIKRKTAFSFANIEIVFETAIKIPVKTRIVSMPINFIIFIKGSAICIIFENTDARKIILFPNIDINLFISFDISFAGNSLFITSIPGCKAVLNFAIKFLVEINTFCQKIL